MGNLEDMGWDDLWDAAWAGVADAAATVPARVVSVHRDAFVVWTAEGERSAELSGRLRHRASDEGERPAIGDWVAVRLPPGDGASIVHGVLPRRTQLARKVPGALTAVQVVAANVDVVLIVAGLDGDYNPRRLERALVLAWDGGAQPAIVLNKADLLAPAEVAARLRATENVAPGVPVRAVSAATGEGLDGFERSLPPGRTAALIGSSGVGKSTLVNRLLGADRQRTAAVRASDSRGRHTTSHRELLHLPGGALLIDTPGLRELQLWAGPDALEGTFAEVDRLAASCRFVDCAHDGEPGCAVIRAAAEGTLSPARLESYRKLQRELRYLALRQDERGRADQKQRWRAIHKAARKHRPRE
ncbi:MAG TPA: ribosome small subunit-dependent GTPase A [Vicinamibacteria bacterium]|nr:ribosome small subunit-dependent GTPase A [Vicinamibacteria bacterium]